MASINVYLTFLGNCEEAFNHYKSIFGGEFSALNRFGEMPPREGVSFSDEEKNQIMHVSLPIGTDTVLMGSDAAGASAPHITPGNNFSLSVNTDSKDQADVLFKGLSAGGNITMPMDNTFWGSYFGMCTDKFGVNWMVSFEQPGQDN